MVKIKEGDEPSYKDLASIYGDENKNYPYIHDTVSKFRDYGLVNVVDTDEGRKKSIMLTEKGEKVAEMIKEVRSELQND